jgi:hypothetical protein
MESPETFNEEFITTDEPQYTPAKLTEGYENVNNIQSWHYYASSKTLDDYLKDLVVVNFADDNFSITEVREEFRETNYIRNLRHLRTFFIQDSSKTPRVIVFDITSCI